MMESNSEKYPQAWKVFVDCVRKWEDKDLKKYPEGWKYGIPNPKNYNLYLYSECPGKLFVKFNHLFYRKSEIWDFRIFLWKLELSEGKINEQTYNNLISN